MPISSRQLFEEAFTRLQVIYDINEAGSIAFLLLKHLYKTDKAAVLADKLIAGHDPALWQAYLLRLQNHEPIQYVLGETEFYGLTFTVNPSVLIPRPETEELVDWIVREHQGRRIRVLDIGTGSGCIAVSLAVALPQAQIWALDVSPAALATAKQNALLNGAQVNFIEANILRWEEEALLLAAGFDVVISNPPYVTASEKVDMRANVTQFEPHLALFVPDEDPLLFYRCIARFCAKQLLPGGACYLEINERFAAASEGVLQAAGLRQIHLYTDLFGKPRHLKAMRAETDQRIKN